MVLPWLFLVHQQLELKPEASAFKGWELTAFKWKSGLVFLK